LSDAFPSEKAPCYSKHSAAQHNRTCVDTHTQTTRGYKNNEMIFTHRQEETTRLERQRIHTHTHTHTRHMNCASLQIIKKVSEHYYRTDCVCVRSVTIYRVATICIVDRSAEIKIKFSDSEFK